MSNIWPSNYDSAFLIRDDDLSYYTSPTHISKIYSNAWENNFKISFFCIPQIKSTYNKNVPPQYRDTNAESNIKNNEKLNIFCKDLKIKNLADFYHHGLNHTDSVSFNPLLTKDQNLSEFFNKSLVECIKRIDLGEKHLQSFIVSDYKIFTSPQNLLTTNLVLAAIYKKLVLCDTSALNIFFKFPFSQINFNSFSSLLLNIIKDKLQNKISLESQIKEYNLFSIPFIQSNHIPLYRYKNFHTVRQSFKNFKKKFDKINRGKGYFVLCTHFHDFYDDWNISKEDILMKQYLDKILDYVSSKNIWKCTFSELNNRLKNINEQ